MAPTAPIPPRWTGRRVVVRYRLDDGRLTDAVGEVVDAGDPIVVATRRGEARIARAAVVAAKAVPPRPSRPGPPHTTLSIADMERVAVQHWRPAQCEPLGGWLLRAHHGVTGRANSALALGMPDDPAATLDAVRAFYTARGLPSLVTVPVPADAAVAASGPPDTMPAEATGSAVHRVGDSPDGDAQLAVRAAVEAAAWVCGGGVSAYTLTSATAAQVRPGVGSTDPPGAVVELADVPDPLWRRLYRAGALPPSVIALLTSADEQVFVSVGTPDAPGTPVAIGRGSHAAGWIGVTALEVVPEHRRRGLGRLVLTEIARWGQRRGARSMFLQTEAANPAANRFYLSAGFAVHHRYDYLTPGREG